jgi:hypothetical protein
MRKITTEKAMKNQLASAQIEGFRFTDHEIDNVRKCLGGELTFKQFTDRIVREVRSK